MAKGHLRVARLCAGIALGAGAWAASVAATGGFHLALGPLSVSSRTWTRPLALACVAATLATWLAGPNLRTAVARRLHQWRDALGTAAGHSRRLLPSAAVSAAAVAAAVATVGWVFGSQTASGPDSFAYVSQAALWRSGRLDVPIPLAARAPWPNAAQTFVPFGYRARDDGRAIVPITAPGVPMAMAGLQAIAGHRAAFVVTPLAGALTVWFTFLVGRRAGSPAVGLAGCWLVATSPAFLFMLMWPMTDVPAAATAALVMWLVLRQGTTSALLAGLAAGLGLLTRPNFVLIAMAVFAWLAVHVLQARERRANLNRAVVFAAGLLPAAIVTIALNLRWYGRSVASGYGNTSDLLSFDRVALNAHRYFGWLVETSPVLLVGALTLLVPAVTLWGRPAWRTPALFLAVTVATVSVYLVYQPFTEWWYLRFLLPTWPALAVATGIAAAALARVSRAAAVGAALIIVAVGIHGVRDVHARGIFALGEERYVSVAALVAATTEPTATVLTVAHSGTVRYYAGRETIRYDLLDAAWLDRTLDWLAARGRKPYILVEDWELPEFRSRFGLASSLGQLNFAPVATWESAKVSGRVYLFDPVDRGRFGTADPGAALERGQPRSAASRFPKLAYE